RDRHHWLDLRHHCRLVRDRWEEALRVRHPVEHAPGQRRVRFGGLQSDGVWVWAVVEPGRVDDCVPEVLHILLSRLLKEGVSAEEVRLPRTVVRLQATSESCGVPGRVRRLWLHEGHARVYVVGEG